ncbi:MAG: hydrogenase maturation nickel metallochaperone HypA [Dehalococcoidia bacterium]|nr:hydrogenase maturation nickel metallochaperone HypA [Dehalococcoidia bacterium]MDD5494075.1 hydrogenase maturation nickel metallochaperone HypA [Dehalococcoidia bacterium]
MHELSLVQDILDTAVSYAREAGSQKVVAVFLRLGALRDVKKEWIQYYFNFIRKGTMAEEAEILVTVNPIICSCHECGREFEIDLDRIHDEEIACPGCSAKNYTLISGTEFRIEGIEVV